MDTIDEIKSCHTIWFKFRDWLENTFGSDLRYKSTFKLEDKIIEVDNFDDIELNKRLVGYEVIEKIEEFVEKECPEIKIVYCDDDIYASSILLLIPHPKHGITIMFISQCTTIQNKFFLYDNHYINLLNTLKKMKRTYKE